MGLLLSVLVVCVGVLEAISCVTHFRHGYLPYWLPAGMHERARRRTKDPVDALTQDEDDDEASDELSRILMQNGGGGVRMSSKETSSAGYGLTPILTEHRRRTPILDDDVIGGRYVENNVDECYGGEGHDGSGIIDGFRPISPSSEPEGPIDESYVSSTGKFLEVPPDGGSPLQRSSSEETLHDSAEGGSPREVESCAACDVVETPAATGALVVSGAVDGAGDVVFKVDEASPVVDVCGEEEFEYPESRFSQTMHLDADGNNITDIPEEEPEENDLCLTNDPVLNLVSAAAFILRTEAEESRTDLLPRKVLPPVGGTTSSCRPLSVDLVAARIPTPQAHRESMPFDLVAAHAASAAAKADSRPETPRKANVDISWPVFHPEPVIKWPNWGVDRGDSFEEVVDGAVESEVTAMPPANDGVEEVISRTHVQGTASAPVTPFVNVPGSGVVKRSIFDDDDLPRPPVEPAPIDRFGRITPRPYKNRRRQRRGSLERPSTKGDDADVSVPAALKDKALSKSLPDFFFEENAAKQEEVAVAPPVTSEEVEVVRAVEEVPEEAALGKDITRKESSIKRRRGYRKKERSTWTPSRAKNRVGQEARVSSTETDEGSTEMPEGGSFERSVSGDSEHVERVEEGVKEVPEGGSLERESDVPVERLSERRPSGAIQHSALSPVEVLHHAEVEPEAGVFATPQTQARPRLREPAKASSFEEAPPPAPASAPVAPASDVMRATNDDDDEDEREVADDDFEEQLSEAVGGNVKMPQQSADPAPFWLIFSGEYTKAMSKDWHSGHFCCWQCDESLTGQRYVLRDDHPYCIKCYESVFANMCEECSKTIGIDSKDLSYKDKHWHEACFLCNKCRVSLVDKQFGSKADKIYCSNCYDAQFASRCDGCGEIFRAGTKKMEYKTRQWHEKCFCCCVCKSAIGTKSFIPREQEIYCATCYEEKFATRCVKCNKIITSGGVTYKNEPWHRECFTCTHCNTSLAGQRFTSRDEKPYCAECFGELFAKRCTACSKPITGIGGTRFISFEDRHWHNDCFICASCRTSLVGRGFITDAEDIICPECAKQKLM